MKTPIIKGIFTFCLLPLLPLPLLLIVTFQNACLPRLPRLPRRMAWAEWRGPNGVGRLAWPNSVDNISWVLSAKRNGSSRDASLLAPQYCGGPALCGPRLIRGVKRYRDSS
jgi:hypothetical protein